MRRLLLAALCAATVLPALAYAGTGEPFGLPVQGPDYQLLKARSEVRVQAVELRRIEDAVRGKPVGWINREVQMSPVIATDNLCITKAVAKCEVAQALGLECRIVTGFTHWSTETTRHAMAAVQVGGEWYMLDNQHVIANYSTPTDRQVSTARGVRLFHATASSRF